MDVESQQKLQQECWNRALYAYGTAWLFRRRQNSLRWKLRAIQFLGVVVPVSVGSVALSFGAYPEVLKYTILAAGILSFFQLMLTVWSLSFRWEDNYAEALSTAKANTDLRLHWEDLAKNPPDDLDERVSALKTRDHEQELRDTEKAITDKENSMMMRASLLFYKRKCAICQQVPTSMKPTKCATCGDF